MSAVEVGIGRSCGLAGLRDALVVEGAKRSRTAQGVAAERAVLADMGVLADPFARGMLTPSMGAIFWIVHHWPYRVRARSVTLAGLAARVLWFDAQGGQRAGRRHQAGRGDRSRL